MVGANAVSLLITNNRVAPYIKVWFFNNEIIEKKMNCILETQFGKREEDPLFS